MAIMAMVGGGGRWEGSSFAGNPGLVEQLGGLQAAGDGGEDNDEDNDDGDGDNYEDNDEVDDDNNDEKYDDDDEV